MSVAEMPAKPKPVSSPAVYQAIAAVMSDLSREGIAKGRKNPQQGFSFRGIDDMYNALAPLLAKAGLIIVPTTLEREIVERHTKNGGVLFYVTCKVRFDLISAMDGSSVSAVTYGEAMDAGDKATNKAMSAAYKYMAMQTFCIPTEGDNDADATTHEPLKPQGKPAQQARRQDETPSQAPAAPARQSPGAKFVASAISLLEGAADPQELEAAIETIEAKPGWAQLSPVDQNVINQNYASILKGMGHDA